MRALHGFMMLVLMGTGLAQKDSAESPLSITDASRIRGIENLLKDSRYCWVIDFKTSDNETNSPLVMDGEVVREARLLEKEVKQALADAIVKPGTFRNAKELYSKDDGDPSQVPSLEKLYVFRFSGPGGEVLLRYYSDKGIVTFLDGEGVNGSFNLEFSKRETVQLVETAIGVLSDRTKKKE